LTPKEKPPPKTSKFHPKKSIPKQKQSKQGRIGLETQQWPISICKLRILRGRKNCCCARMVQGFFSSALLEEVQRDEEEEEGWVPDRGQQLSS